MLPSFEQEYKSHGSKGEESLEQICDGRGTGPLDKKKQVLQRNRI